MQKYDRTTRQLYQGRKRHNRRILADNAIYDEAEDRQRSQVYEYTRSPDNFNHSANTPPDHPSTYLTTKPEIKRKPDEALAKHRSVWLDRQTFLGAPQSYGDHDSAVTPPEGSYLRNSSSNEQADFSHLSISRQTSNARRREKAIAQFDGIEEPPGPSSYPKSNASGSRRQRRTHSSNSHHHSAFAEPSQHSHHSAYLPQPQETYSLPRPETVSSSHQTCSRQASRHQDDGCCCVTM